MTRESLSDYEFKGFTKEEVLNEEIEKSAIDILLLTDLKRYEQYRNHYKNIQVLYFGNMKDISGKVAGIERFEKSSVISKALRNLAKMRQEQESTRPLLFAIISPIGRCGKTTLGHRIAKNRHCGNWIYVGLEDFNNPSNTDDTFIYILKNRKDEELIEYLKNCTGIIPSPFYLEDARKISVSDLEYLCDILKNANVQGAVFDLSPFYLSNTELLSFFDKLIVPYQDDELSLKKIEHFDKVFDLLFEDKRPKQILKIAMNKTGEEQVLQKIFE